MLTRRTLAALALAPLIAAACAASHTREDGAGTGDDAGLSCEGEYLVFDYTFDDVPGSTGCTPAGAGMTISPRVAVTQLWQDWLREPNVRLPRGICAAAAGFYNIPLHTGARGLLDSTPYTVPAEPWVPQVILWVLEFLSSGSDSPCSPGGDGEFAVLTGGTWHVLQGGSDAGDWIEIEARDVTFEPLGGHDFRLDRMLWRAQLRAPVILPEP
jgi:hypothetical protein